MDMERFDEAEKVLQETARAAAAGRAGAVPAGPAATSRAASTTRRLKNLEYAAQFTPLVGRDPLFEMLALIYASQADFERATEALRKQVGVNPNNADAHRRLGDGYVRQGRTNEALTEFLAALLVDPANVLSHVGIAQLQLRAGQPRRGDARGARGAGAGSGAEGGALRPGDVADAHRARPRTPSASSPSSSACRRRPRRTRSASSRRTDCGAQISVSVGAADHQAAVPLLRQLIDPGAGRSGALHHARSVADEDGPGHGRGHGVRDGPRATDGRSERLSLPGRGVPGARADAASSRLAATRYREAIDGAKRQRAAALRAQ